ncbi:hypothetical protein ACH5RR_018164 [Cinchona calisaya]|uniref:Uncharacterized protein n=1 Tax=Cinchona calisaya TaxID=153742 RepID=A0ABD2ZNU4_9GENT
MSIILTRPFLATGRALIDVQAAKLQFRIDEHTVSFNVFDALKFPSYYDDVMKIDIIDGICGKFCRANLKRLPLDTTLIAGGDKEENDEDGQKCLEMLDENPITEGDDHQEDEIGI